MKYIIQTIEGEIKHDFSFTLLRSFEFHEWLGYPKEYVLSDTVLEEKGCVPVGSVEFVLEYLKINYDLEPKPVNIPLSLYKEKFLKRKVLIGFDTFLQSEGVDEVLTDGEVFVKSLNKIKVDGYPKIVTKEETLDRDLYLYSELIEIESEYRCFVFNGELLGINNYSGDFTTFPNVDTIKEMIEAYDDQPIAFILDVGVLESGETVVIEAHDFFSCGLYGFADMKRLPIMYSRWIVEFLIKNKK